MLCATNSTNTRAAMSRPRSTYQKRDSSIMSPVAREQGFQLRASWVALLALGLGGHLQGLPRKVHVLVPGDLHGELRAHLLPREERLHAVVAVPFHRQRELALHGGVRETRQVRL